MLSTQWDCTSCTLHPWHCHHCQEHITPLATSHRSVPMGQFLCLHHPNALEQNCHVTCRGRVRRCSTRSSAQARNPRSGGRCLRASPRRRTCPTTGWALATATTRAWRCAISRLRGSGTRWVDIVCTDLSAILDSGRSNPQDVLIFGVKCASGETIGTLCVSCTEAEQLESDFD